MEMAEEGKGKDRRNYYRGGELSFHASLAMKWEKAESELRWEAKLSHRAEMAVGNTWGFYEESRGLRRFGRKMMCVRQEVFVAENPLSHNFDLGRASHVN